MGPHLVGGIAAVAARACLLLADHGCKVLNVGMLLLDLLQHGIRG